MLQEKEPLVCAREPKLSGECFYLWLLWHSGLGYRLSGILYQNTGLNLHALLLIQHPVRVSKKAQGLGPCPALLEGDPARVPGSLL